MINCIKVKHILSNLDRTTNTSRVKPQVSLHIRPGTRTRTREAGRGGPRRAGAGRAAAPRDGSACALLAPSSAGLGSPQEEAACAGPAVGLEGRERGCPGQGSSSPHVSILFECLLGKILFPQYIPATFIINRLTMNNGEMVALCVAGWLPTTAMTNGYG